MEFMENYGLFNVEAEAYRRRYYRCPGAHERAAKRNRDFLCTVIFVACLMWTAVAAAASGRTYLAADAGYRTGDFGTGTTFRLFQLAPSVGYASDTWVAGISVPFLRLQADDDLGAQTESGIGDILIQAGRRIVSNESTGIRVNGSVALKLPTADETKGLGTGEADYAAVILLNKSYGSIGLVAQVGYIVRGDASTQIYNDSPMYALGISKSFNMSQVAALYGNDGAFVDGTETARSITISGFRVLSTKYAVRSFLSFGLSDGAQDLGVSIGFVRWF